MVFNQGTIEEKVLQEINRIPMTFDYSSNTLESNRGSVGACVAIMSNIIDELVDYNVVNQLKLTLNAKRMRNTTVSEYNACLENNIVFQLYKYDKLIGIFNILGNNMLKVEKMNFQTFYTLVLENGQKKVVSAKQFSQSNQAVRELLIKYSHQDTESREYDYIFASLKELVISYAMQSVLFGKIEEGNKRIATIDFFRQFSYKDNKAALDLVITNEIAKRLSVYY